MPGVSRNRSWVHRWVGLPMVALSLGMALLVGWKQQLTRQLRAASADQRLEECLRLERRLQSLDWVPGPVDQDGGRCRREAAQSLWARQRKAQALRLQAELVASKGATPEDISQLQQWKGQLQRSALAAFEAGDLTEAVALLRLTDTTGADPGVASMMGQFQQTWDRNKADLERAEALAARSQWWEAISALNGLTHPYWRQRSLSLRKRVEASLARIEKKRVDTHGRLPYSIPPGRIDALVKKRVAAGVPDWQAFSEACRALGGRVSDGGPEATCER